MDIGEMLKMGGEYASAIKSAFEAVKAGKEAFSKTSVKGPEKEIIASLLSSTPPLLEAINRLQEKVAALEATNIALKATNDAMQAFDDQRSQYELRTLRPHAHAYAQQSEHDVERPTRLYCQPCFDKRKLSLLQLEKQDFHIDTLQCPQCGLRVQSPNDIKMEILTASRRRRGWDEA